MKYVVSYRQESGYLTFYPKDFALFDGCNNFTFYTISQFGRCLSDAYLFDLKDAKMIKKAALDSPHGFVLEIYEYIPAKEAHLGRMYDDKQHMIDRLKSIISISDSNIYEYQAIVKDAINYIEAKT